MSNDKLTVRKRNGDLEPFNVEKIEKLLKWASEGLIGVSVSDIAINAKLNLYEKVSTEDIHKVLIETTANLISLESPNYQFVASRLLSYQLRKNVWGGKNPPRLLDFLNQGIQLKLYDSELLTKYSEEEINKLGEYIDHDRDYMFTYAGLRQMCDKYLIRNRVTSQIFETPQFAYMLIAMAGFINLDTKHRIKSVKKIYNYFSKFKINLPTPVMAGLRTTLKSYSSCMLLDIDDTKESLTASATAISLATANRYGVGFNIGRIRAKGSSVRNGEVVHTGVIPFLKIYEASCKAWQQNGLRGGGATVGAPFWHYEIEDIVSLKNNSGTDDSRVRKLDYCIGLSKLFYTRFLSGKNITLFSPNEVPGLYDAFGTPEFDSLYEKYEAADNLKLKKQVSAVSLFSALIKERVETGRIYIFNVDHANEHSSFKQLISINNLCCEINHPLIPLQDFNDPTGEIGVCILSAINLLEIKSDEELKDVCEYIVKLLEELIDIQGYFNKAAENFTKKRRSLGIGITNLAALLAKNNLKYADGSALMFVDELMEKIQFYLLKAGVLLAKEKGPCEKFDLTKYSDGILPIDTYRKNVDNVVKREYTQDWKTLREEIKTYGLRHSTYTAMMPCESSSVIQCSTNGCEPIRSLIVSKKSKAGNVPVLVPGIGKYDKNYEIAFDMKDMTGVINLNAVIQKWTDMALSTNLYYNYEHYPNRKLPDQLVIKHTIHAYNMGLKSLYYLNTPDGDKDQSLSDKCSGGACAI